MNHTSPYQLFAAPFLAWTDFVLLSTQMMMSSAQAIGYRTSRMLLAGDTPDARDEEEFDLKGEENAATAVASTQTVALGLFRLGEQLAIMTSRQILTGMPLRMSPGMRATAQQSPSTQSNFVREDLDNAEPAGSLMKSVPRMASKNQTTMHHPAGANRKRQSKHTISRAVRKTGVQYTR